MGDSVTDIEFLILVYKQSTPYMVYSMRMHFYQITEN
jgi:hypothetical protein